MRNILFFVPIVFIMMGCGEEKTSINTRSEEWVEDLAYFENEYLTESKTFSKDSIYSCKTLLADLKTKLDTLTDNQIILQLSKCVAMANNGHTTIQLSWMDKIPLRFYWFADGLHIIKTDNSSSKYLGSKVLKINSIEIDQVLKRLNPYLPGIKSWKKFTATNYLSSPEILNGIGLTEMDSMNLTLLKAKDTIEVTFKIKEMADNKYEYETWADLHPGTNNEDDWNHVLKSIDDQPLYLKHMKEGVFYTFLESERIAYFSINALWYNCPDFNKKIDDFIERLKSNTDYDVVFDLRYYTGGNYIIPVDLATEPPEIIDADKNIYLITSNMTFSAGLVTAARIKYYAEDKIVIVGENVGDNLKFWAERENYKLPNSGIDIQDSGAEHDWQDDNFTIGKSFWVNAFYGVPAKNLNVDKKIQMSYKDYLNKTDPILDWILNENP